MASGPFSRLALLLHTQRLQPDTYRPLAGSACHKGSLQYDGTRPTRAGDTC